MLGLGWPELIVAGLVGFFVFGPERLPYVARDAARMVRQLRSMALGMSEDIRAQLPDAGELGLDSLRQDLADLRDLHPKRMAGALFDTTRPESGANPAVATGAIAANPVTVSRVPGAVPRFDVDAT